MFAIENVTETDLPQVVLVLLVVPTLGQLIAGVGADDIGVEVGGVVSQQATTHQLLSLPQSQ